MIVTTMPSPHHRPRCISGLNGGDGFSTLRDHNNEAEQSVQVVPSLPLRAASQTAASRTTPKTLTAIESKRFSASVFTPCGFAPPSKEAVGAAAAVATASVCAAGSFGTELGENPFGESTRIVLLSFKPSCFIDWLSYDES